MAQIQLHERWSILDQGALAAWLARENQPKFRLGQIRQAVFSPTVSSWADITTLPEELRVKAEQESYFLSLTSASTLPSFGGSSTKLVLKTHDDLFLECVIIFHKERTTLCVSSQVGCPLKCSFCTTGKMGFFRNLTWYEIVDQLRFVNMVLDKAKLPGVRNIVFMGMGEPLLNYENVMRAIDCMIDPKSGGLAKRHITLSTSGLISQIKRLIKDKRRLNFALSLHAPTAEIRAMIMPIEASNPLPDLMQAVKEYSDAFDKRIFIEYIMLKGINDHYSHAEQLARLLRGMHVHVNLIAYNSFQKDDELASSDEPTMRAFQGILTKYSIPSTIRGVHGRDVKAACGQLGFEFARKKLQSKKTT